MGVRKTTPAALAFSLLATSVMGQTQNLQPESQQEFRRTFGFSGTSGAAASVQGSIQARPTVRQNLRPESAAEFSRAFSQSVLSGTAELQKMSTPATIHSTVLNAILSSTDKRKYLVLWHLIAVDITAVDHRANLSASPTTYHEQFGPARTARALALIHQAMFEASNAFEHKFASTIPDMPTVSTANASRDAAIIEAAYQIIAWLYPGLNDVPIGENGPGKVCIINEFSLSTYYTCSLETIKETNEREAGIAIGRLIAGKIMAFRSHDGAERPDPVWGKDFIPRQPSGGADYAFTQWQQDPVSQFVTALGGYWGEVRPFSMTAGFQFRPAESDSPINKIRKLQTPGASDPGAYKKLPSYVAVEQWGREPRLDPSRKPGDSITASDALLAAQFWAYDGTVNLCAPARLYNQIAARVLDHLETTAADGYPVMNIQSVTDVARFYALVNIAMADAAIAAWDAKYHFQFPRPVTYIRAENTLAAAGTIITKWFPVGAQNTNSDQTFNITPPFPAYPSGHAVFGGALFGILRQYLKPGTEFGFLSDEFNGKNKDAFNYVRCSENDVFTPKGSKFCSERKFTIDCAERENADSRIFMGVHWVFDADDGIYMGNQVAKQVYRYAMNPIDQNGQLQVPQSHVFSVDQAVVKKRKDAVCPGITFPAGWDNENETMGFGPLNLKGVPPF